jgi:MinD superfamily P-loop ATPase
MRIAVASVKGGTGKTTLATNLGCVSSQEGLKVAYLDCDVEEPNGHLFLKPEITQRQPVCGLLRNERVNSWPWKPGPESKSLEPPF